MQKSSKILDPECARCKEPMNWHSTQVVGVASVNVFRCDRCDKLTAQANARAADPGAVSPAATFH